MKKFPLLMLIIAFLSPPVKAPEMESSILMIEGRILHPYNISDTILLSFILVESGFKEDAVNPVSGARGILQIMPIMIRETNRILDLKKSGQKKYTWDDAFDPVKSMEIWYIVQGFHNPDYHVQEACKVWFGRGTQYDGLTWQGYYNHL